MFSCRTDFYPLADPHGGDLIFKNIDFNPDPRQIGNIEQRLSGVDVLSLLYQLLDDYAGERRVDREPDIRFAGLLQLGDLTLLDPEKHQSLLRRRDQTFAVLGYRGDGRTLQLLPASDCQEVLLLRCQQVG